MGALFGSVFSFSGGRKAYAQEVRTEIALLNQKMTQVEAQQATLQAAEQARANDRVERAVLDTQGEARLIALETSMSELRSGFRNLDAKIDALPARVVEVIRAQPLAA